MFSKNKTKGQALILIAIAMAVLIGMTALAVDGGSAYVDRRSAQNAADTAALAAGFATASNNPNWRQAALNSAAQNGYANGSANVEVYKCNETGASCGQYQGNAEYIQVIITSTRSTFFGGLFGQNQITNRVQAIVRARAAQQGAMVNGNAVVALAPHECRAITFQGNASMTLQNGGIFVNSDCANEAFFNASAAGNLYAPSLEAVGGVRYNPSSVHIPPGQIRTGVAQQPYPPSWLPDPSQFCNSSNTRSSLPGNNLAPGIYCLTGSLIVNGNQTISGDGVTIVLLNGELRTNGNGAINISAPASGPTKGLAIYLPVGNTSGVTINGNANTRLIGSVLAPGSNCKINGTSASALFRSQFVCYTIDLTGTGDTTITYNEADNYSVNIPPTLELVR
jgi:Flp pilus assembly protein TadG